MSYPVTLILVIIACFLAVVVVGLVVVWFLRNVVSRCIDRKEISPSQVNSVLLIALASLVWISALGLPAALIAISGFYVLIASVCLASAIEKLVVPPQIERRPPWYHGEGDPSWGTWPPPANERAPRRFSMLWLAMLISMLCVSMGALSIRYRWEREQESKHRQAVARIVQLGGTVQQGDVSLAGTAVRDDDLVWLADLHSITSLNLGATDITNEGLKHVFALTGIQVLTLSGTNIDDDGLSELQKLRRLSIVLLRQTNVTGVGVKFDARLQMLDVSLCPLTREGLVQISRQSAKVLSLAETPVGDEMLAELKAIEVDNLDLTGTKVTPTALSELQAHRPGLQLRSSIGASQRTRASKP